MTPTRRAAPWHVCVSHMSQMITAVSAGDQEAGEVDVPRRSWRSSVEEEPLADVAQPTTAHRTGIASVLITVIPYHFGKRLGMRKNVTTDQAPLPIGPYSQA